MKENKISIVVPIYKVENELERCVKSLINQTYCNIEIILVDDGSPDNCPQLCDYYATQDSRIKVIHKKNGGLSDARNAGLDVATGDYILFVDSDDYIDLGACQNFSNAIEKDVDIIVGEYKEVTTQEKICGHSNLVEDKIYTAKEYVIKSIQANEWYAPAWLNLYRTDFLKDNNLYYKKGILFEDHQMLPRLFLTAKTVKYLHFPFYYYVIRENSIMTSQKSEKQKEMSLIIYSEWLEEFKMVEDKDYQRFLYGALVRYYLANCRSRKITKWEIPGFDFHFALKYALNTKDKLKCVLFNYLPYQYILMANRRKGE